MGCSVAYHLGKLGLTDAVLLERFKLTSGTTWHSAAQVRALRSTPGLTRLAQYSASLYASLEEDTGQTSGWRQCGSLSIATNPDRHVHILRQASLARAFGVEAHEVDRTGVGRLWPLARIDDVIGGVYSPGDGRVNPSDTCAALIKGARASGLDIVEDTPVSGFGITNGRISAVRTPRGDIGCETVVLCGGLWSREVGMLAGVSVPLHACEHYALVTQPVEGVHAGLPILGDHDGHLYIREEVGGLLVGCFEPDARPIGVEALPVGYAFDLLREDWEHFEPMMRNAIRRIPALERARARTLINGPESFTPDGHFLLGPAPELGGFFVGCGMNSVGLASGGGAGRALAEWVVEGEPTLDLSAVDVRRFAPFRNNLRALRERSGEVLSLHYAVGYPGREFATARGLRTGVSHEVMAKKGACFGERAGWERPSYFTSDRDVASSALTFSTPGWFGAVRREHLAARERVALFDQSPLGKLLVQGRGAEPFLRRICANDVSGPPGTVTYSPVLNTRGGYESDVVVLRLATDSYLLVTGAAQVVRDRDWLDRHSEGRAHVSLTDVTSVYSVLAVMGPRARTLLSRVSSQNFSNPAFPYLSHRPIEIGYTIARAARISYVGELGWELYVPTEGARSVRDALYEAGADLGLCDAGTFAQTSLRVEKGYCAWGQDIGPDDTPLEAGMGWAVRLEDPRRFIGREALLEQSSRGTTRRRVLLRADDPEVQLLGLEPILVDGEILGHTTSAAHGHSIGRPVAMGYVRHGERSPRELVAAGRFELEVAGRRCAATASLQPWHDPSGRRPRS